VCSSDLYKNIFNKKYGFKKDESHSVAEISRLTGYKKSGLETIVQKGRGAFFSNPTSVRPNVKSPHGWGMARLYSAISGGKAARIDKNQLIRE
jgi:hypothetical protein